jgi:hypothetical protein
LQIERELILSTDKSASKIPIMYDTRSPPGPRRSAAIPLLQRSSVAVAPDHPPKQIEAWVSFLFIQIFTLRFNFIPDTNANPIDTEN